MSLDLADVRPSVLSWLLVGLMSVTFISAMKFLLAKFPLPGASDLVASI